MEIYIDISVFLPTSNLGIIHGRLEVQDLPKEGEYFSLPILEETHPSLKNLAIAHTPLRVEHVVENGGQDCKLIMLQDLV